MLLGNALKDPGGLRFTLDFVDGVLRPEDKGVAARNLADTDRLGRAVGGLEDPRPRGQAVVVRGAAVRGAVVVEAEPLGVGGHHAGRAAVEAVVGGGRARGGRAALRGALRLIASGAAGVGAGLGGRGGARRGGLGERRGSGGGERRVQAQHAKGKLTARERVELLLDEESTHLAGLSDFIGKPVSLQSETAMGQEHYDIVLL